MKDFVSRPVDNLGLKDTYNEVYSGGSSNFYTFDYFSESLLVFSMLESWRGLQVLEIGCGEGRLAALIGMSGAGRVDAVDYSESAIQIAQKRFCLENVLFDCRDFHTQKGQYDVVVLQGVAEHLDRPFEELQTVLDDYVRPGGALITSSPSFLNPRGYVWMTLQLLFNVPMSLSDLHFLCPFDFEDFAHSCGCEITVKSTDQDWAAGQRLLVDFQKRLPKALADAGLPSDGVPRLLEWLKKAGPYFKTDDFSGANVAYMISKPA
jgi:SAM-dependent methyltransferase